jgi:cellulose biosynthesis protein BcsQ
MTAPIVAFFNNKGGVGKTTLVHHVGAAMADRRLRVLIADGDPQSNLTSACLFDERVAQLWLEEDRPNTIYRAIRPQLDGDGPVVVPVCEPVSERLSLLPGDLALSATEDSFASSWNGCLGEDNKFSVRVTTSLWKMLRLGADDIEADIVLLDLGPNLGSINRAALLASDYIVVPVGADLFSLQGMKNFGPRLRSWRSAWQQDRLPRAIAKLADPLPDGSMQPIGYVVLQHTERLERMTAAYARFGDRYPEAFRKWILDSPVVAIDEARDPYLLGKVRHYRSLMAIAHEARKPVFKLLPADGAVGSLAKLAHEAWGHFREVADKILEKVGVVPPGA